MTFAAPWMLALLAAVPVLFLLHRRRAPVVVRVASIEPYRASGSARPASPRRAADLVLACLVVSAVSLALAAAGLSVRTGRAAVVLLVDRTPSMSARTADGASSVGEDAERRARAAIAAAVPGADIVPRDVFAAEDVGGAVAAARADGFGGVVFVTDAAPARGDPTIVVAGPAQAAGPNASLRSVTVEAGRVAALVCSHASVPLDGVLVAGTADPAPFRLAPRGHAIVVLDTVPPEATFAVRIEVRGDSLSADDAVVRGRPVTTRLAVVSGPAEPVRAALRALGWTTASSGAGDLRVAVGEVPPAAGRAEDEPLVLFAARPGIVRGLSVVAGPRDVDGTALFRTGRREFPLPSPVRRLAATGRIQWPPRETAAGDSEPLLADSAGVLAARIGRAVVLTIDPEAGDWRRDASFAAVVGAAADMAAGGVPESAAQGVIAEGESAVAAAPLPAPDAGDVRAVVRPAGKLELGTHLALAGAAAAAAAAWLGRRR